MNKYAGLVDDNFWTEKFKIRVSHLHCIYERRPCCATALPSASSCVHDLLKSSHQIEVMNGWSDFHAVQQQYQHPLYIHQIKSSFEIMPRKWWSVCIISPWITLTSTGAQALGCCLKRLPLCLLKSVNFFWSFFLWVHKDRLFWKGKSCPACT